MLSTWEVITGSLLVINGLFTHPTDTAVLVFIKSCVCGSLSLFLTVSRCSTMLILLHLLFGPGQMLGSCFIRAPFRKQMPVKRKQLAKRCLNAPSRRSKLQSQDLILCIFPLRATHFTSHLCFHLCLILNLITLSVLGLKLDSYFSFNMCASSLYLWRWSGSCFQIKIVKLFGLQHIFKRSRCFNSV